MYNYWLQYPRIREQEIVLELQKRYQIQKSAAYEDIRIIKYLLGDLNKATKDYHRYRFIQRNEESYEMAKRIKDAGDRPPVTTTTPSTCSSARRMPRT